MRRLSLTLGLALLLVGCSGSPPVSQTPATASGTAAPAPPGAIPAGDDSGDWVLPAKDYASTRFSALDQITPESVKQLKVAGTFSTGFDRGQEAAPIVAGNTMYVVTPYPNIALRARPDASPARRASGSTSRSRSPPRRASPAATSSTAARSTPTGRSSSTRSTATRSRVDAETGKRALEDEARRHQQGRDDHDGAAGREGQGAGRQQRRRVRRPRLARRRSTPTTGKIAWRAYSTGPDKDVLIGPRFKPFYAAGPRQGPRRQDLAAARHWKIGGGTVWGWISYDPELNLIYYGTGNPGPWNAEQRPGDNKWTCGIFARDPDTGEAVWFYQMDARTTCTTTTASTRTSCSTCRSTGSDAQGARPPRPQRLPLRARPQDRRGALGRRRSSAITATKGVDLKTGRLIENDGEEAAARQGRSATSAPASPGAKDWQPSAFSPRTGLLYIPHQNLCMDYEGVEANYIAGTPYVGANVEDVRRVPGGNRGEFTAWDPVSDEGRVADQGKVPGLERRAGDRRRRGLLRDDGRLVQGRRREERAKLLWQFKTGSGIIGQPMTYRGPDGKQYVAILSGVGGWAGAIVAGDLDPRDGTAALGFVNAMKDLPQATARGGTLYRLRTAMRRVGSSPLVMAVSCAALVWNLGRSTASTPTSGRRLWATVRVCSRSRQSAVLECCG